MRSSALRIAASTVPILPIFLIACSAAPKNSQDDVEAVLAKTVELAKAKVPKGGCMVASLGAPLLPPASATEWTVAPEAKMRFRRVEMPSIKAIPAAWLEGISTTSKRYGCSQTIQVEQPEFFDVEEDGAPSKRIATVGVNDLCGPMCGEQFSITFHRQGSTWVVEKPGLSPTGVSY